MSEVASYSLSPTSFKHRLETYTVLPVNERKSVQKNAYYNVLTPARSVGCMQVLVSFASPTFVAFDFVCASWYRRVVTDLKLC